LVHLISSFCASLIYRVGNCGWQRGGDSLAYRWSIKGDARLGIFENQYLAAWQLSAPSGFDTPIVRKK
jgi:hypothetical protein